jgi:hypothetical protein
MSSNKGPIVVITVVALLFCVMCLIYGFVQRIAAIKQQEIALEQTVRAIKLADENKMLVQTAQEAQVLAARREEMARKALDLCEQKQKKK